MPLVCPACRPPGGQGCAPLEPSQAPPDGVGAAAALRCQRGSCGQTYPVTDGVPLLVPDPQRFGASERRALDGSLELGPGRGHDFLAAYGWATWADLLAAEPQTTDLHQAAGTYWQAVDGYAERIVARAEELGGDLLLDAGCGLGRAALHLARGHLPTLGLDLRHEALAEAQRVATGAPPRWIERLPGRGLRWRAVTGAAPVPVGACRYAVADVLRPPVRAAAAAGAIALNLFDSVASPWELLTSLAEVLRPGALLLLSTPLSWDDALTPTDVWPLHECDDVQALQRACGPTGPGPDLPFTQAEAPRELRWVLRKHSRQHSVFTAHTLLLERR